MKDNHILQGPGRASKLQSEHHPPSRVLALKDDRAEMRRASRPPADPLELPNQNSPAVLHPNRSGFNAFLKRVRTLDYEAMIIEGCAACTAAQYASGGNLGVPRSLRSGGSIFTSRVRDLLFFLRNRALPAGAFVPDLRIYKEIAETLIAKGQLEKEVLAIFDGKI
jgi:hypothetical protein